MSLGLRKDGGEKGRMFSIKKELYIGRIHVGNTML